MSFIHDPNASQRQQWEQQQHQLREQIQWQDEVDFDPATLQGLRYIGGVDLSFPENDIEHAVACLVVLSYPELEVVYTSYMETTLTLPYIAGFLAFREVDPLCTLLKNLKHDEQHRHLYPQVVLVDGKYRVDHVVKLMHATAGNGRLHPRTCGVACHLGLVADIPTIGVAKNFLVIEDEGPLLQMSHVKAECKTRLQKRGDHLALVGTSGTVYGAAQRTTDQAPNPVFVSQGHRVSLETALHVVLAACRFRIPEPIRCADQDSRAYLRKKKENT